MALSVLQQGFSNVRYGELNEYAIHIQCTEIQSSNFNCVANTSAQPKPGRSSQQ